MITAEDLWSFHSQVRSAGLVCSAFRLAQNSLGERLLCIVNQGEEHESSRACPSVQTWREQQREDV